MPKRNLSIFGKTNNGRYAPLVYFCLMVISERVLGIIQERLNISGDDPLFFLLGFIIVGLFLIMFLRSLKAVLNSRLPVIRAVLTFAVIIYCFGVVIAVLNWITGGALL